MIVLTVSEVANPEKSANRGLILVLLGLFFFSATASAAAPDAASTEDLSKRLGDCNWQVSYRGRHYDLTPLTREALSRPIENDIRYAIQRVPEANARLENMTSKQRNARTYTIIASVLFTALIATHILENEKNKPTFRPAQYVEGGLFLGATFLSWNSTRSAKRELVHAVEDFNANSPHKIEPVSGAKSPENGAAN